MEEVKKKHAALEGIKTVECLKSFSYADSITNGVIAESKFH